MSERPSRPCRKLLAVPRELYGANLPKPTPDMERIKTLLVEAGRKAMAQHPEERCSINKLAEAIECAMGWGLIYHPTEITDEQIRELAVQAAWEILSS